MSKRNGDQFERIPRDKYKTPYKAVLPLVPYLRRDGIRRFAEPCCDGDLIQHLESFGLYCDYRGDIATGRDALKLTAADCNGAAVITNPPFKYADGPKDKSRLARDLIRHFLDIGVPSWLLLPHDFSTNEYAPPFLRHCPDIVVVGRVKWIANSEHNSGFDNSCWYRFDVRFTGNTVFHNERALRHDRQTRHRHATDRQAAAAGAERQHPRR
jgi:hypothetical protein